MLTTPDAPSAVLGFHTLSSGSIKATDLPDEQARRLPRHPIPVALLGRLSVSRDSQGLGLGRLLLADAIKRTLAVADEIGIYALIVDAIDAPTKAFYGHFEFCPFEQASNRLFLPLKPI